MRHANKIKKLGRTSAHRKATLQNMAVALIKHKRITTTLAKAKALRPFLEPLVTRTRANNMHARRVMFDYLQDKEAVKEMFGPILVAIGDRPGGYLRIIRMGYRKGDGAQMAMIEFVDFNETYNPNDGNVPGQKKTRRSRRSRRGGGQGTAAAAVAATASNQEEE